MSAMLRRVGTEEKVQQEIFARLMRRNEIVSYDTSGLILIFRDYEDGGIQAQQYEMFIAYKGGSACINPVPGSIAYMDTLRET